MIQQTITAVVFTIFCSVILFADEQINMTEQWKEGTTYPKLTVVDHALNARIFDLIKKYGITNREVSEIKVTKEIVAKGGAQVLLVTFVLQTAYGFCTAIHEQDPSIIL